MKGGGGGGASDRHAGSAGKVAFESALTEFPKAQQEHDPKPAGGFFSRLFNRSNKEASSPTVAGNTNYPPVEFQYDRSAPGGSSAPSSPYQSSASAPGASSRQGNSNGTKSSFSPFAFKKGSNEEAKRLQQRKYWMPDESCNTCYDCGTTFSTFKRKHHCRLCGQIFCSRCSERSLPGLSFGFVEELTIRVCNYCYDLQRTANCDGYSSDEPTPPTNNPFSRSSDNLPGGSTNNTGTSNSTSSTSDAASPLSPPSSSSSLSGALIRGPASLLGVGSRSGSSNKNLNSLLQTSTASSNQQNTAHRGTPPTKDLVTEGEGGNEQLLSMTLQRIPLSLSQLTALEANASASPEDSPPMTPKENDPTREDDTVIPEESDMPSEEDIKDCADTNTIPTASTSLSQSQQQEQEQEDERQGLPPSRTSSSSDNLIMDDATAEQENVMPVLTPAKVLLQRNDLMFGSCDVDDALSLKAERWTGSFDQVTPDLDSARNDQSYQNKLQHQQLLAKVSDSYLRAVVAQLVKAENLSSEWIEAIVKFAMMVCSQVVVDVTAGDNMDIREYVHIKTVPGETIADSIYVNGLVCTKNIAHKKMRSNVPEPRILVLRSSLEFQRTSRLCSFDSLVPQEGDHLKIIVSRIAELKPDILIVEKTVSRLALDFLREAGITVVLNIKPPLLTQIARFTCYGPIPSADNIVISPVTLGSCGNFRVQVYKGQWGRKTLMFFEGCSSSLGCSIILRGNSDEVLDSVKRVLTLSIHIAHNQTLEQDLLLDICAIPTAMIMPSQQHQQDQEQHEQSHHNDTTQDQEQQESENDPLMLGIPSYPAPPNLVSSSPGVVFAQTDEKQKTSYRLLFPIPSVYPNLAASPADMKHIGFDYKLLEKARGERAGWSAVDQAKEIYTRQHITYMHSLRCSTSSQHCLPFSLHIIDFYSKNDLSLGEFLEYYCFDLAYLCPTETCGRNMLQHERAFLHGSGRLNVTVYEYKFEIPSAPENQIQIFSFCKKCGRGTPFVMMSKQTWRYSFGKFLELTFHNSLAKSSIEACGHDVHKDHVRCFFFRNLVAHFEYESLDIPKLVVPPAAVQPDPRLYADIVSKDIEQLTHVGQQIYDCIHAALKQLEKSATKEQQSKIRECSATQQAERATFFQQLTSLKGETNPLCCNRYKRKLLDNVKSWQLKLEKMAEEQQPPSKDNSPLQSVTNSPKEAIRYNNEESFSAFSALSSAILSSSSQNNPHFVNTSSLTLGTSPSATSSSPSTTPSPSAPSSTSVSAASSRNASPIHSPATTPRLIGAVAGRRQAALDLQMNGSPMYPSILPPSSEEEEAQEDLSAILSFPPDSHKNPLKKRAEQKLLPSLSTSPTSSEDEPKNTSNNNADSSKSTTATSISVPVPTILTTTSVIPRSISPAIPAAIANNALALELTQLQPFALSPPESFVTPWQPSSYSISTASSSRFNRKEEGLNNRHRRDSSTSILITHQNNNGNNNFNSNNNTGGSMSSSITLSTAIPGSPSQTRQHTIGAGSGSGIGGFKGLEPPRQIGGGVATSGGSSKGFLRHSISALLPNSPAPSLSFISDIGALAHKIVPGFLLPEGHNNTTIIINKEEPSSIIAHTLCSHEYRRELFHSIYNTVERKRDEQVSEELMLRADLVSTDKTHIKNKFTHTDSSGQKLEKFFCMSYFAKQFHALRALYCTPLLPQEDEEEEEQSDSEIEGEREQEESEQEDNQPKKRTTKEHKDQNGMSESQHNGNRNAKKVGDATKKQSKQKQRKIHYPHDDEFFIQSLSRCKPWAAQGGKSGSAFSKTVDERFILKQISVIEVRSFLEFGPLYFQYLARSMFQKIPTALVKILGLYCIQWKAESGKPIKQHIVVMENLFYDKNVTKSFDLKGSLRSRYVASNPTLPRQVLMDENLLESLYASPICINEKSKIMLSMAVWNDSLFLSELGIMDYSLLIGLDESTHELVVGVIDFMRKYTWDKQLETWVKWSGIMGGGRGKVPTVISPKQYKTRFRAAMWLYFVMIPDEYTRVSRPALEGEEGEEEEGEEGHSTTASSSTTTSTVS